MPDKVWSQELLDEMRHRGDPPADEVVALLAKTGQTQAVATLMQTLVRNEDVPSALLPDVARHFLESSAASLRSLDAEHRLVGEDLFERFGGEILMALGFYALPMSYAAVKGVQVIHRSAFLSKRPMQRVWETTQFLIDVMSEGGLAPGGMGLRTAQKVRLMHAAVRHLVQNDPALPWDVAQLGVPINQEDLAATLMTFSCVVLEALARLGIKLSSAQQEAYLYAWRTVGEIMGVDARLIPANMDEAWSLTRLIAARQLGASDQGKELTTALVEGLQTLVAGKGFDGFVPSGMRFFLENDRITNNDVAVLLGVPPADWTGWFISFAAKLPKPFVAIADRHEHVAAVMRSFQMHYIRLLLLINRGPHRPAFRIPQKLQDLWLKR